MENRLNIREQFKTRMIARGAVPDTGSSTWCGVRYRRGEGDRRQTRAQCLLSGGGKKDLAPHFSKP